MASAHPRRLLLLLAVMVAAAFAWSVKPEAAQAQIVIEVGAAPPPRIETYPHYYYDDRDVYWAHGHWYYRRAGRWYYYRDEPPPLHRHRMVVYERRPYRHEHEYEHERDRREGPAYYHHAPGAYHRHAHRRHRELHRHVLVVR